MERVNKRPTDDTVFSVSLCVDLRQFFEVWPRRLLTHGPPRLLVRVHAHPELAGRIPYRQAAHLGELSGRDAHGSTTEAGALPASAPVMVRPPRKGDSLKRSRFQ